MSSSSSPPSFAAPVTPPAPRTSTFKWSRFTALMRVDLIERWRAYGVFLLAILVIQLLIIVWLLSSSSWLSPMSIKGQMAWYYGFLLAFAYAFACLQFAPMGKHSASLLILMRPASVFEKWLHATLITLVVFPLAYTVVYLLATVPFNAIAAAAEASHRAKELAVNPDNALTAAAGFHVFLPLISPGDNQNGGRFAHLLFVWWYLIITGFCTFALMGVRRAAVFKAIGLAVVILILSLMMLSWGSGSADVLMSWGNTGRGNAEKSLGIRGVIAMTLFWLVTPVLLWLSGYFALRERDLT